MTPEDLAYERHRNMLLNEFSASLLNATPATKRWIERQIGKLALERCSRAENERLKFKRIF